MSQEQRELAYIIEDVQAALEKANQCIKAALEHITEQEKQIDELTKIISALVITGKD